MSKQKYWRQLDDDEINKPGDCWRWVANNQGNWFRPFEPTDWPPPRDARTDPPTEKDADSEGCILAWSKPGFWSRIHWGSLNHTEHFWHPLPPPIPEQKSEAEMAYLEICQHMPMLNPKEIFIAGYEAAKKGGGE